MAGGGRVGRGGPSVDSREIAQGHGGSQVPGRAHRVQKVQSMVRSSNLRASHFCNASQLAFGAVA